MLSYKFTIFFSCMGYFIQAITINFAPLLFNTFEKEFNISLSQISLLIAISFATQFIIDFLAAKFSSKINLRLTCIIAHVCAFVGMIFYAILPDIFQYIFFMVVRFPHCVRNNNYSIHGIKICQCNILSFTILEISISGCI